MRETAVPQPSPSTLAIAPSVPRPRIRLSAAIGFALVHVAALGVYFCGFSWQGVVLCVGSYYLRMFAITAGFHRFFSHRTYQLGRIPQFLLAFLGQTAAQKGVLWWAAHHRHHHRFSDQPEDIHSPVQRGFWWSHMGWILAYDYEDADLKQVPDLTRYPELVWLNKNMFLATMLYALGLYFTFSWTGLFYGYFLSTALLWHGTFSINSVMHVFGRRTFATKDDSRNSMLFALITMGEGWHNNHHYYPGSAAQGFRWWQLDASYYLLWLGERVRLVRGLRRVPERLRAAASETARAIAKTGHAVDRAAHGLFEGSGERLGERIDQKLEQLSLRWAETKARVVDGAHHAVQDLESARLRASERLETLQRDYAHAKESLAQATSLRRNKARLAIERAESRLAELRVEIEGTRRHLVEVLESLLVTAESLQPSQAV